MKVIILIALGFTLGFILSKVPYTSLSGKAVGSSTPFSQLRLGYKGLTNPLLDCINTEPNDKVPTLNVSRFELDNLISGLKKEGLLASVSIYFRDLNNGPTINIDADESFIGASLLKLPVFIAYYKEAESGRSILDSKIKYEKKLVDENQYFNPSSEIKVGNTYTTEELLNLMIKYSDNNAAVLLTQKLSPKVIDDVFSAAGFGTPPGGLPYPVDTKTYGALFRILFNSSYLNRDDSEKLLKILTDTEFNKGITRNLPPSLLVAHKFGVMGDGSVKQLHDCGIIYYPGHPYLLCVMTKGSDFDNLATSLSRISDFIYGQVSKLKD